MRSRARFAMILLALATIGCDQATKQAARSHLAGRPRQSFFGDAVRLEYAENKGAFLSIGSSLPAWARIAVFTVATGAMLLVIAALSLKRHGPPTQRLALGLLWAGGASNLVDRVLHGSVVDFMNVGVGWLRTGIFNVADMAIVVGVLLMVLSQKRVTNSGT